MMRQALHRCLRSAKNKASKSKPFWLPNPSNFTTNTTPNITSLFNTKNREYTKTTLRPLTRHFCTANTTAPTPGAVVTVTRSEPELVGPAGPTPRGVKKLSFLDDRDFLRHLSPMVQFYRHDPSMRGKDPARVVRDALARALVPYYPLAGRLREGADGRLTVDCTGEGVLFVEADADVELHELGDPPQPHLPWFKDFLFDVPISGGIVDSPLFYIQVTRLKCGGFVLALRLNHIMCDAAGLSQFITAVGEMARGAHAPRVTPVWNRELLSTPDDSTRDKKDEHKHDHTNAFIVNNNNLDLAQRSIFLGPPKLLAIRNLARDHHSTTFETLTACLWRSRTRTRTSLLEPELETEDKVGVAFSMNARDKTNKIVPFGYYGNAVALAMIEASARRVCEGPIEYAIGLVKKAKEEGTKEYMSWKTKNPNIGISPFHVSWDKCLLVSDLRQLGYGDVDFGWGKASYGGVVECAMEGGVAYVPYKNNVGEDGILVSICLKGQVMGRFETELENMLIG